ncbi:Hypothetical protein KNT65_gp120 [Escherichia phage EcS1]|uniref:Uncharacterized protein n=1 Tax=Escherichia phage EcS1 TaxID=2083276 RepID=A0A2Z5ZC23_9CAUD|nr:Hypothetical protein KNT65_gp120 [Escherichia phage EcS1]BBC78168.1 Hypothetical protein [Escherichia phage EcS1]
MTVQTKQEALEALRSLLKEHFVQLGCGEKEISLEELIIARDGNDSLNEIYEIIDRG